MKKNCLSFGARATYGLWLFFNIAAAPLISASEHWETLAPGISKRTGNSAVWTGHKMIVWGGGSQSVWLGDGGRYDLENNTWQTTSLTGAPSPRWMHGAVWTGTEMLVWGGRASFYTTAMFNDGARYNPASDNWQVISGVGAPSVRSQFPSVWTGTEMIVWGGWGPNDATLGDGARYNPTTDTWTPVSSVNAPIGRSEPTAVWTGEEMIVFGGLAHSTNGALFASSGGGRYNPQTDTWTPLPTNGAPSVSSHVAVWTGTDMIVWGGRHVPGDDQVNTGARYNLAENKWYPVSTPNLTQRMYSAAVWSGHEMVVWGGLATGPISFNDGARYNPVTDIWTPVTQQNAPDGRMFWRPDLGLWTGQGMLFYGGSVYPQEINSTALYVPDNIDGRPVISTQPHDVVALEGHSATLSVAAYGTEPFSFQWSFNETPIADGTNSSLLLTNLQSANAGPYQVTISNSFGAVTSAVAHLTVVSPVAVFDLAADYSTNSNPAGVWSYGWESELNSDYHLFTRHGFENEDGGAVADYWLKDAGGPSAVYHNPGDVTIVNNGGQGNYPPGTVWFGPGYNGASDNFGVIRFTVPMGGDGTYGIDVAVHTSLDGSIAGDCDFHVVRNGLELFGHNIAPNTGTSFGGATRCYGGDTIDFAVGRGPDGQEYGSGLKIQATIALISSNPPVPAITGFNPSSGPTGTVVTITGRGFSSIAEQNSVHFGNMQAVVTSATTESLVAAVPAAVSFTPITVAVNSLVAQSAAPFQVTFTPRALNESSFSSPAETLTPGDGPVATVIGDLDGDGLPDLAIANFYSDTVAVYRNDPGQSQSLAAPVNFATGHTPWDLVLADIDGDGKLDLVTVNLEANTVSVLRNISTVGEIKFAPRLDFPVGSSPHQASVGDLDGDGRPEIVTADYDSGTISVLQNISDQSGIHFAARVDFTSAPGPSGVGMADLDGDGKLDVVVAHHTTASPATVVLRNTSHVGQIDSSSLTVAAHLPGNGNYVVFGDFDGDGRNDLVIPSWYADSVSIFRNISTPGVLDQSSFGPQIILSAPGSVKRAALADLDGDGRLDIAFPTELNSALSFYRNVGGSNDLDASWFGPRVDLAAGWNGDGISIGDLDVDGLPDIVFCNFYDDTVFIYRGERVTPPVITAEPVSQTVPLGSSALISVTATGSHLQYHWYHDDQLAPNLTGPAIQLPSVTAADGGGYFVIVENSGGSVTSQVAVLTVVIDRVLTIGAASDVNEGDLVSVPLTLVSPGDVGGLDFTIDFDPDLLTAPEIVWDDSLNGALTEFNVPSPGQLRAAIAMPATAVPGGTQFLATVSWRARTVQANATATLDPTILDVSDSAGDPILFGSTAVGSSVQIIDTGAMPGDNNGNHRLDIGDASLLMRLLARADTTRTWDLSGNDLNHNQRLDSGDVVKILRIIAGIDSAPSSGPFATASKLSRASVSLAASSLESAELSPARLQADSGQLVTFQLLLKNLETSISGASFALNYPVDALRFRDAQGHRVGPTVPGTAVAVWNLAPGQTNYATQTGQLKLALSASSAWSSSDVVLAEFTFEVQPGAATRYQWPISVTGIEVTGNGYNNRTIASAAAAFIGRDPVAGSLLNLSLGPQGVSFSSTGDSGADYRIDVSDDLVHWSLLQQILNHPGSLPIQDADAAASPHRFYRSVPLR